MTYDLIVTSAARPHLLRATLTSLLAHVDHPPARILIHDDAAFEPGSVLATHRWMQVKAMLSDLALPCETLLTHADPPRRLGMALVWLLANVTHDYVLYSQDDFVTVRDLPLQAAGDVMAHHGLHQIRFNKRATLGQKDTWQGVWRKKEFPFGAGAVCTVADHWYFQTGLWRVATIRAALAWLTATPERTALFAASPAEEVINRVMDGEYGPIPGLTIPHNRWQARDANNRAQVQRTFIWGPIGSDRYIRHVGTDPVDFAGDHAREAAETAQGHEKTQQAWDEIATYQPRTGA